MNLDVLRVRRLDWCFGQHAGVDIDENYPRCLSVTNIVGCWLSLRVSWIGILCAFIDAEQACSAEAGWRHVFARRPLISGNVVKLGRSLQVLRQASRYAHTYVAQPIDSWYEMSFRFRVVCRRYMCDAFD